MNPVACAGLVTWSSPVIRRHWRGVVELCGHDAPAVVDFLITSLPNSVSGGWRYQRGQCDFGSIFVAFDTLGEITVLAIAALAVFALTRNLRFKDLAEPSTE